MHVDALILNFNLLFTYLYVEYSRTCKKIKFMFKFISAMLKIELLFSAKAG